MTPIGLSIPRLCCAGPALVAAVVVAAGCGGSSAPGGASTSTGPLAAPSPNVAPPSVPRTGTRPADPADKRVIDAWLATLRRGDETGAARYFARGALVQNGSPVLRLDSLAERVQFQTALPCGAIDRRAVAGPHDFTIVTFVLTERVGGDCGSGTGHRAWSAIRVQGGKITGWFRLPDPSSAPETTPRRPPPAPSTTTTPV